MPETIGLKVVALISGGKDSIFSILHCQAQQHDVIALANLHPPNPRDRSEQELGTATGARRSIDVCAESSNVSSERTSVQDASSADIEEKSAVETDLDSYMYQTVGHSVVPLFASMLGLPLYRRAIRGTAQDASREYSPIVGDTDSASAGIDETEDLFPLLREVMIAHPDINAVSTGAILSNYQRTRVESIALRLGLTPLSYLWQYPYLPPYNDLSLLRDMQAVHLDARIIKVASGGLDERILWQPISQQQGWTKVKNAMYRFAASSMPGSEARLEVGAILGEGGEFETLVVDGPAPLFKGQMVYSETVTSYGEGGSASMVLKDASVKSKTEGLEIDISGLRVPPLFDDELKQLLQNVHTHSDWGCQTTERQFSTSVLPAALENDLPMERCESQLGDILVLSNLTSNKHPDVGAQLKAVLDNLAGSLSMEAVVHTTLLLRRMEDFAIVNKVYSDYFTFTLPPSRVTVSCGDALPAGVNIALSVIVHRPSNIPTVQGKLLPQPQRRSGLHVQSRSYWAPANIGPYSQARAVSSQDFGSPARFFPSTDLISMTGPEEHTRMGTATEDKQQKLRIVYIAGQIPLVPSSMQMASSQDPPRDLQLEAGGSKLDDSEIDVSFKVQAILALQHLCRVARATNVRFFTPTVAMLSHSTTYKEGQRRARIAGYAWQSMHDIALRKWNEKHGAQVGLHDSNEDDGTDDEVDLWDLRNRMDKHSLAFQQNDTDDNNTRDGLEVPDYSMLQEATDDKSGEQTAPSMFSVEVQQLPRDAAIEWCSVGIAIPEGVDKVRYHKSISCKYEGRRCCIAVSLEAGLLAEAIKESDDLGNRSSPKLFFSTYALELRTVETTQPIDGEDFFAKLTTYSQDPARRTADGVLTLYVSSQWHPNEKERSVLEQCRAQFVPCFNVWDNKGAALACLAVEQTVEYS